MASYKLLHYLLKGIGKIPFKMLYGISDGLYGILYHVVGYRKKVVRRNLTECFPEKSPGEIKKIEKAFYKNLADNILETCKMGSMSDEEISRRMNFVNIDEVNKVLATGKSVALFIGHYGNWEWISSMPIVLPKNVVTAQIYHKLNDPNFDKVMLENRASHGATNVEMARTARFITELARDKTESIIGFIADQSPRRKDIHHYVDFLNHKTPVIVGTEKIVKHYNFDAWFIDVTRPRRGYYEARFVRMCDNAKSLPDFQLTDLYFKHLEDMIRQRPELYLWSHNRFKYAEIITKDKI